jgi:UDP-N-acetylmuramate: L-alanyl-gamma-D-glutamyl-meso-diaminopimelate ligase
MKRLEDFEDAHLRIFDRPAPPDPADVRSVYLIGICGTGMGSLAGLLKEAGYSVRGSDENVYPPMSTRLAEAGIEVLKGYDAAHLDPAPDLVVVGNACAPDHPEAAYARENGLAQLSLPEALAHFFLQGRRSLVVAGTHGKTTTTGLLVHVLREAGLDPGFLVGGVMANGGVNFGVGSGPHFVVEGDEYDSAYFDKRPKFMHYRPTNAIITSMEFDHADIYDDWADYRAAFRRFAGIVDPEGLLALYGDDNEVRVLEFHASSPHQYYGIDDGDDHVTARNVRTGEGGMRFDLIVKGAPVAEIFLPMSGRHNLRNALGVCAICLAEGLTPEQIARGMGTFKGIKRRQEPIGEVGGVLVIDDFAHHPTAVQETIGAIAERWPERRLVAVFEPRSNSSRRKVFEQAYGEAFDRAELAFLSAPPVRHNDSSEQLMDTQTVVDGIRARGVEASLHTGADALLPDLVAALRPGDVVLIMSNGSFGGIHQKLLDALREQRHTAAPAAV